MTDFFDKDLTDAERREVEKLYPDIYDFGPAFAVANRINAVVRGLDIRLVATAFGMILGDAESTRKPFPNPEPVALYVTNIINQFARKQR